MFRLFEPISEMTLSYFSSGLGAIADGLEARDVPFASSLERAFSVRVFYDESLTERQGESLISDLLTPPY